ncbi:UNVERIFIED_CONTAM: hypothetical protein H355_003781 [Colinus virginianus]|nr:hypothetical protein H355_003781 [Colinus virginianus]
MAQQAVPEFKLILVGDGGVGKTTLVKRHLTGEFEKKYIPTLGVEVHPLKFQTNFGQIIFNVWDTAGQEKFGGLRDGYYIKVDVKDRQVKARQIQFHRKRNLQYYDISARSNYNFEKPFLWLARRLTNQPTLSFIGEHAKAPEIHIDPNLVQEAERELQAAVSTAIDDDDEDLFARKSQAISKAYVNMGCGLCKAKVPSSAGAVHFPKRQQRKNDLSPSSTWAASSSPAADTVVHGSDKNGSSSKIEASTLSPSVSQEVARFPVEDKNKDDMFKRVDQNHQGGTGIGSKAETTNEKQSNSTGFEGEEARQRCDKATSSAATIERKNRLRRKKLSTDAGSPTTGQSSFSAPGVKETLRRRLSVAEKEEWYKRLCNDSLEEGTQKEDLSGSKRQSSPCSVPADERKCSSCEYFLLTESCQDSAHSNTNPKTNATPERSGISIGETSNTCNEPLEEKTKADDSDNSRQTHIKRTSNVSKGGRAVVRDSQEDQERETEPGRHSTSLLPYFPVAQRNSFLSQLDKAQQQEADKLALCVTSEKMKNLELSCCSNKWREKFPSSKDIEHCIQEAYEACVHYNVDAAEEQLT